MVVIGKANSSHELPPAPAPSFNRLSPLDDELLTEMQSGDVAPFASTKKEEAGEVEDDDEEEEEEKKEGTLRRQMSWIFKGIMELRASIFGMNVEN